MIYDERANGPGDQCNQAFRIRIKRLNLPEYKVTAIENRLPQ